VLSNKVNHFGLHPLTFHARQSRPMGSYKNVNPHSARRRHSETQPVESSHGIFKVLMALWGCIQKFPDWVDNEIKINTRWEAKQRVMAAKLTTLTYKTAIHLHLVAQSCTIRSSRFRRPVRKILDIPSYATRSRYWWKPRKTSVSQSVSQSVSLSVCLSVCLSVWAENRIWDRPHPVGTRVSRPWHF
jgi:hypothetical protein